MLRRLKTEKRLNSFRIPEYTCIKKQNKFVKTKTLLDFNDLFEKTLLYFNMNRDIIQ